MANELLAGFEKDDATSIGREWLLTGTAPTTPTTGRRGTKCMRMSTGSTGATHGVTANATYAWGFNFLYESAPAAFYIIGNFSDGSNTHLRLELNSSSRLQIKNSAGTVIWTGTTILLANTDYYIEWEAVIHASAGSTACYLNGSSTADTTAFSGATKNSSGAATINTLSFGVQSGSSLGGAGSSGSFIRIGDVYANSGATGKWGDTKVTGYLPNAAGTYNALTSITTGTAASTNVNEVDDATTDDDSTYVYGTSGKDTYNFPALGFTASVVRGACVRLTTRKGDATARTVDVWIKSGASDAALGSPVSPTTSYTVIPFLIPVNPDGSAAWDQTTIEAAEFGVVVA